MLLTEEQILIQQTARRFAIERLRPFSRAWAEKCTFPVDALREMAALGFMGMLIPEEYEGVDAGYLAYVLMIEEIAAEDASCSTIIGVHNSVGTLPILRFGTDFQKENFLKPLARGEYLGAFCLTEPESGSDAQELQTRAVLDGDHYVLNGVKQFITSGKHADIAIVFAKTNPALKKKGISAFIVPTNTPGYIVSHIEHKMGQEAAETVQITLNNVVVPKEYRIGEEGRGFLIALANLESGRIGVAAQALGMARSALTAAIEFAKVRKTFGKPIIEHQAIAFKLAEMATLLEAARYMIYHAADRRDNGLSALKEAAMAKLFATEAAEKICREAIQIHGGYGYLTDFPVERIYRDVRVTMLYEGTSEIQKMIIAREL